ncbi:tumor necrosis factor receptor superfamily member 14 [Gastrophryne carolinensis]
MCPAGTVAREHCTAISGSIVCIPCVDGTYMDHPNGLTKCMRCRECDDGAGLVEKQKCTSQSNTVCECKLESYCESEDSCDICMKHTVCQPGQFVKAAGTLRTDTVCESCPHGHFSNRNMSQTCMPWKS